MAEPESPGHSPRRFLMSQGPDVIDKVLLKNREWAAAQLEADPNFFKALEKQQSPEFLWIGCSDSRVPANQIMGMAPGEIFVQRNVGNQATHTDLNAMSCIEYAVQALKVQHIIVCGHYNCGAVKAALQLPAQTPGLVNCWISDIRECRNQHSDDLRAMGDAQARADLLVELNVKRQVFHVATSPVVQAAWASGQQLALYGMVYSLKDGLLRKLVGPIARADDELMSSGQDDAPISKGEFALRGASFVRHGGSLSSAEAPFAPCEAEGCNVAHVAATEALLEKMHCHLAWGNEGEQQ